MTNHRKVSRRLALLPLLVAGFLLFSQFANGADSAHRVFAHYMVAFATYGENLAGYQRETREAQAAGIDGFALNMGAWSGPDWYYKTRVKTIYDAAESLDSGFKLFFSVELTNTTDIVEMVATYANRTNTFRHAGKVVLSTYGQNQVDWQNGVFAPLEQSGVSVFFVPFFWPQPVAEIPRYSDAINLLNTYSNLVDGLFLFGAAGLPTQLATANADYTRALKERNRISMASWTPHYWGMTQTTIGRRYFESHGGEGTVLQWESIIQSQPDWVEIVTWNDFNESTYVAPVADPGVHSAHLRTPRRYPHAGYLELSKRYIQWFKSGQEPPIDRDLMFYFYRTHRKEAIVPGNADAPVSWFIGDVRDQLHVTLILTAAAELEATTGGVASTNAVPKGLSHHRVDFVPGPQKLTLRRNGVSVVAAEGPEILPAIERYNFIPTSGYASGPVPGTVSVPAGLRVRNP